MVVLWVSETHTLLALRARFLGAVPQVEDLKVVTLDIGSKLFTPQGEARSCEFPWLLSCWDGVNGEIVSQPLPLFHCGFFLFNLMSRSSLY